MQKLKQVLAGKESNHILPFFWQHGEEEHVLREYMQQINASGIGAVCVESRPHPDFVGPKWWEDLDVIMDEARRRDMKVWVLDDSHFPTGYAVGRIKEEFPELQKMFLKVKQQDFVGPQKHGAILVKWATLHPDTKVIDVGREESSIESADVFDSDEKIIGVVAARRIGMNEIDPTSLIDLTEHLNNGRVQWDVPSGAWRVFTIVQTRFGGEKATEGYLNPLVAEATQVLIDTVYASHYERYARDFGSTFAGFFSDEPRFGNVKGPFASIGRLDMVLPWREDLLEYLPDSVSLKSLPLLWVDGGEAAHEVRYHYMDTVSRLYSANFTGRLGTWCRKHGVEYIGHVIEDNNAHARLGYGAGHFYRSLWEQDMSGIDVVLHQILPGMDDGYFKSFTSTGWDGEFFHYGLAKMGSSLGHLDPKKQGRTMCEVYGAYGWAEGLKLMKWITDHMLVRGINYFVPHAFSPKKYPDLDCPPHFYADGHDPQYRHMHMLNAYTNRISHLLSDGIHIAPVAILYHAEAEWSGDYMLFQRPARVLMQHQIDFDVVPAESVTSAEMQGGRLRLHEESFSCLVIPYAEALPHPILQALDGYLTDGLRVCFVDGLPERSSEGIESGALLSQIARNPNCSVVSLSELAGHLQDARINEIRTSESQPYLRYYRYRHADGEIYMFFNEHPHDSLRTVIELTGTEDVYEYDAFENKMYRLEPQRKTGRSSFDLSFDLSLDPYESKLVILTGSRSDFSECRGKRPTTLLHSQDITGEWAIGLSRAKEYPEVSHRFQATELQNLTAPDLFPDFSGTAGYELEFHVEALSPTAILVIEEAYEVVGVWVNGHSVGTKICSPYRFDITESIREGSNDLKIEVTNTLAKEQQDFFSQFMIQEPTGLLGQVRIDFFADSF